MSDWPSTLNWQAGGVIATSSDACPVSNVGGTMGAGGVWPAANRALYIPFFIEQTVTAYQMAYEVTVQSGNYDAGIYDENAVRLVSVGSTAVPAVGLAIVNIADTVLTPGVYFMALCIDNTTAAVLRGTSAAMWFQMAGCQQQAVGAVTLPNPATFANPISSYMPWLEVVFRSVI